MRENKDYCILKEHRYDDVKEAFTATKIYASTNYVWCPCCKRRATVNEAKESGQKWAKESGYSINENACWDDMIFQCDSCGHIFKSNTRTFEYETPEPEYKGVSLYESEFLVLESYPLKLERNKIYECVGYDKTQNKLSIMCTFIQYIPGKKMIAEIFNTKLILHLNTGKAYYISDKRPDKKKCFGSRVRSTIMNISNTTFMDMHYCSNEIVNFFFEKYMELKHVDIEDYEIFAGSDPYSSEKNRKLLFSIQHNCHPNLIYSYDSYTGRKDIILQRDYYHVHELYKYYPHELIDTEQLLCNAVEGMKVPNSPKFMKEYRKDISQIQRAFRLKKMGFKDVNIIYTLMQTKLANTYFDLKETTGFIKEIIAVSGEKNACRKILAINSNQWIINDSVNAYTRIKSYDESLLPAKVFCNNLKDIHDILTKISNRIRYVNEEIIYSEKESQLEANIKGISFVLAKDTNELVKIGSDMHMCVGDYRDSALGKACTIISMKKNNRYVGCLELKKKTLIQAKAFANEMLCNEEADALEEWVLTKGILTTGCYDFEHLRKESNGYYYDYHRLELDDDGYVTTRENNAHRNIIYAPAQEGLAELPFH